MTAVIDALRSALGAGVVEVDEALLDRCRCDATGVTPRRPLALLRPTSSGQVSTALRICNEHRQPVLPQGGLTGLAGGATPQGGEIVLSLERMRGIEELDRAAATVTVLAGTPLEAVQAAADGAGFLLGLDLGSRGSCQVGGNIATNAGGMKVIRYGMAREQVLGLEAVLADGTVVSALNKMLKNNAGYDVKHLFIGSEGTLGIVTRVVLRLHPKPKSLSTALAAADSYEAVVRFLRRAQAELGSVSAFEAMWRDYYAFVTGADTRRAPPLPATSPFYVAIEFAGIDPEGDPARFEEMLARAIADGGLTDAVIAQSEREARAIWDIREGVAAWDSRAHAIHLDVSLPIGSIGEFAERVRGRLQARWPGSLNTFYGHIGDSNLHASLDMGAGDEDTRHAVEATVYEVVREMAGSVSAEHGIGTLKRAYLGYSRSEAEIGIMRLLKHALDPNGILNPGKVL
ncbi:MAG: FAD-binding oxidoreductase [Pseudomonadota bacterium]